MQNSPKMKKWCWQVNGYFTSHALQTLIGCGISGAKNLLRVNHSQFGGQASVATRSCNSTNIARIEVSFEKAWHWWERPWICVFSIFHNFFAYRALTHSHRPTSWICYCPLRWSITLEGYPAYVHPRFMPKFVDYHGGISSFLVSKSPIYLWESGLWIPWSHWIGLS